MTKEISAQLGDLQECNREQIHLSGAIQDHGALIFFTPADFRIQAHSANTGKVLGFRDNDILGQRLDYLFKEDFFTNLQSAVKNHPWKSPGAYLRYQSDTRTYDVYMFYTDGHFGVEFEVLNEEAYRQSGKIENLLQDFMGEVKSARQVEELSNIACRYIRETAGIDRVMMYRFLPPTMHGEVIGEDRVMGSHSFMHHRFPSSDIPKPARDLYLRNKVRFIPNIREDISPISPNRNSKTGKPWDLTDSRLRSVAPIHVEYLKNMGVEGSMSFAVVVNGALWGLIACHHLKPFAMTNEKRSVCSTIADIVASQASLMETLDDHLSRSVFETRLKKIIELSLGSKDPLHHLLKQPKLLMEAFNCTGAAVLTSDSNEISGLVPPPSMLKGLYATLREALQKADRRILAMEDLRELVPGWTAKNIACGFLAIQVNDRDHSIFVMFRPEFVKMITWGGDPVKKLDDKNFAGQINPRKSFEAWQETVENKSTPWLPFEVDGASFMTEVLFDSALKKKQAIEELTATFKARGAP